MPEDSAVDLPAPERELPPAPKAFNLPSRATDDTGELKLPPLHQSAIQEWLKDSAPAEMVQPAPPPALPAASEPVEADADITDPAFADFARWLEDIRVAEDAAPPGKAAAPATGTPAASDLSGWLEADEEVASPRDDLPEWLRAAAPRGTGILSAPPDKSMGSAPPPATPGAANNLPDWLAEIAPPGTGMLMTRRDLDQEDIFDALAAEFELPDWLQHMDKAPENKIEPLPAQTPPAPARRGDEKDTPTPVKPDETPDWLAELAAVEPDAAPPTMGDALPAWLVELESETTQSDWLPAEAAEPGRTAPPLPDWLETFATETAASLPSETLPENAVAQPIEPEAAYWLNVAPEIEEPAAPAAWLPKLEEAATESTQDSLLAAERTAAGDFPDWLHEIEETAAETAAAAEIPDWLAATDAAASDAAASDAAEKEGEELAAGLTFTPASLTEDLPDWFDYLFSDEAPGKPALETEAGAELLPDWLAEFTDETALAEGSALAEAAAEAEPAAELAGGDLASVDMAQLEAGELEQVETADDLAGWLSHLPAAPEPAAFDADLGLVDLSGDEWLKEPGLPVESAAVPLPALSSEEADEFASAELPDWLRDSLRRSPPGEAGAPSLADLFAPSESKEPAAEKQSGLPDWLQPADADGFDAALQAALLSRAKMGSTFGGGDEWSDVLETTVADAPDITLPPASEFAGMGAAAELAAADIPDWLKPFKPRELRAPGEMYAPTEPLQETGPLAGMRGVIDIEPVIAQPRQADSELPQFTAPPMQRQQASLLRQLAQASPAPVTMVEAVQHSAMAGWLRLLLALLLLAAIIVAAMLPDRVTDLVGTAITPLPAGAAAANQAIAAAAGQPVLVAFDYTPAMSGELGPAAQLLLGQLAANGSPVLTISQSAAGVTLASQAMSQVTGLNGTNLGYLPGEAVGLRLLGQCLPAPDSCRTIAGNPLALIAEPVSLVILLTADQENLINWVEQVGGASQTPLLAAVTQSLSPAAAPYFVSGQLAGLWEGLPAAVAYEQLVTGVAGPVTALSRAQGLAYWLVILLLIGGNLFYLITGLLARRHRR
ncbi:MAG: hypothetical protein Fur0021_09730 [Candidatus Promineifilaceae bacterium]